MTDDGMGPIAWANDEKSLARLIAMIEQADEMAFDTETTGLEEHAWSGGSLNGGVAARTSMATFTLPPTAPGEEPLSWVLPLSHPDSPWLGKWREVLRQVMTATVETRTGLIAQNAIFDSRYTFAVCGVDISDHIIWDTQMSSHLLDETRPTRLKIRASETFGIPPWDDFDLSTPGASERVPLFDLGEYAARDTYWTWRLYQEHQRVMIVGPEHADAVPEGDEDVMHARLGRLATWVGMPMVGSLAKVEQRGLRMDEPWVRAQLAEHESEAQRLLAEMIDLHNPDGTPSTAATSKWFMAWTQQAVTERWLRVAAVTEAGNPQWTKAVLTRQAHNGSRVAQLILDQRGHSKLAEYLRSWLGYLTPRGTMHPRYNAGRVVTGRLSSSNPNAQQITKALKPAVIPRDGNVIVEIDLSQIELRIAAHVSRCVPMIEAYRDGRDLHRIMAGQITGKAPEDVTKEERQQGKAADFGLLYGMGPDGFREYAETVYDVSFTEAESQDVSQAFFDTWDGLRDWHTRQVSRAQRTGQVVSPIGRVRRLPDIWSGDGRARGRAERMAINAPVQGFGSDLMQMAMASIQGVLPGHEAVRDAQVIATVHDSVVVEVPADRWEEVTRECMWRMTDGILPVLKRMDCDLLVPLAVEATASTRWGIGDVGVID